MLGTLATFFGVRWFQGITESGTGFPDGCQTGLLALTGVSLCILQSVDNLGTNSSPKNASFSCICYVTFYALKRFCPCPKAGILVCWVALASAFPVENKMAQRNVHGDGALADSCVCTCGS